MCFGSRLATEFIKEAGFGVFGRILACGWCFKATGNVAAQLCSRREAEGRGVGGGRRCVSCTQGPPWSLLGSPAIRVVKEEEDRHWMPGGCV